MDAFDQSALSASITFFNPELALTQHHHTHHPHLQQQQLHVHHQLSQPPLHHQQPLSQPQSQAQTPTIVHHGPRKYKSRKSRPCDMCRQRQISCKIDVAPPCAFCSTHQRPCTFIERPKKKKRPTTYACDNDANNNSFVSPLGEFLKRFVYNFSMNSHRCCSPQWISIRRIRLDNADAIRYRSLHDSQHLKQPPQQWLSASLRRAHLR